MPDISALQLSDRARNALRRSGVGTVEQLSQMTPAEIGAFRGVGAVLYNEIMTKYRDFTQK